MLNNEGHSVVVARCARFADGREQLPSYVATNASARRLKLVTRAPQPPWGGAHRNSTAERPLHKSKLVCAEPGASDSVRNHNGTHADAIAERHVHRMLSV